jgi:hypothetical protein
MNKLAGEASPYYFFHPQVPERIKRDLPAAKIILLLRDPVRRAYSHYNHLKGIDPAENFDDAVVKEATRVNAKDAKIAGKPYYVSMSHHAYSYISMGMYFKQLSNWLKYYSRDEILILKSEDMYENPQNELKKVYQFLGLKEIYPADLKPKNQRHYAELNENEYRKYKALFSGDSEQLKKLLGDHFSW